MKLVVDQGNTRTKVAVWDGVGWVAKSLLLGCAKSDVDAILERYPLIESAIFCSTAAPDNTLVDYLRAKVKRVLVFDALTPTPIAVEYRTPATLGGDRLATAVGAWADHKGRDLIVIDFGSAITVDFVTSKGEFIGGNISTGLAMRFAALNHFTGRLPMLDAANVKQSYRKELGNDTNSAIVQGVVRGICFEIEGYLRENEGKVAIFTGGDALFFEKQIKNTIFVNCEATLNGLLSILDYNA